MAEVPCGYQDTIDRISRAEEKLERRRRVAEDLRRYRFRCQECGNRIMAVHLMPLQRAYVWCAKCVMETIHFLEEEPRMADRTGEHGATAQAQQVQEGRQIVAPETEAAETGLTMRSLLDEYAARIDQLTPEIADLKEQLRQAQERAEQAKTEVESYARDVQTEGAALRQEIRYQRTRADEMMERAEQAEALLAIATVFQIPDGAAIANYNWLPEGEQWALVFPLKKLKAYPTREAAFAAWRERTGRQAE